MEKAILFLYIESEKNELDAWLAVYKSFNNRIFFNGKSHFISVY